MSDDLTNRTAADVARELVSQPDLLDRLLPPARSFLESTTSEAGALARYTGARSTSVQHEERNLRIGALRLLGASDREIEAACQVTRRSIPIILQDLEKSRRLTPLKERLAVLVGDNAERSAIALRVLLDRATDGGESIELAGMIKATATALGITTQNLQLLTGAATEILDVRVSAGREEVEAWAKANALPIEATVVAIDSESGANPAVSEQSAQITAPRHEDDTDPTARLAQISAAGRELEAAETHGGGVVSGATGAKQPINP